MLALNKISGLAKNLEDHCKFLFDSELRRVTSEIIEEAQEKVARAVRDFVARSAISISSFVDIETCGETIKITVKMPEAK